MKKLMMIALLSGLMTPAVFAQQNEKIKDDSVKVKTKENDNRKKEKVKIEEENGVKVKNKVKDKKGDGLPPKSTRSLEIGETK